MLRLNLKEKFEKWVTNKHEAFEDTEFADFEFKILLRPMSQTQLSRINQKCTRIKKGVEIQDYPKMGKLIFITQVIDWEGISDDEGRELSCSTEVKEQMAETQWSLVLAVNNASTTLRLEMEGEKEEERKNLKGSGDGS